MSNKRVCDLTSVQTLSNKTLDETCVIQSFLSSTALANLPAPGSPGRLSWLTDDIRGLLVDTGTQWVPVGGEYVNVRVFGADPTGTTDSKAAIQLAINTGYPVYIPFGTYRIDNTLTCDNADQAIFGDGWGSILRCNTPTFNLFNLLSAHRLHVANLRLEGAATDTSTEQYAFMTTGAGFASHDVTITNVHFTGQDSTKGFNKILLAWESNRWVFTFNLVEQLVGNIANYGYAFQTGKSTHHRVIANHFIGTPGRGRHAVYFATGASYNVAALNLIENFDHSPVAIYSFASQPICEQNIVAMNVCRGGGLHGTGEGSIGVFGNSQNNLVFNNQVYNYDGHGIVVDDANEGGLTKWNIVSGNMIRNNGWSGIEIVGAKKTTISGNSIIDNDQDEVDVYPGINLRSVGAGYTELCQDTAIIGNTIRGEDHRVAIRIDPSLPLPTGTVCKSNVCEAGGLGVYEFNEDDGVEVDLDGTLYRTASYGSTTQINAPADLRNTNIVTPTDTNNFTIRRPEDVELRRGKLVTVKVSNTTGGSLGTITWFGFSLAGSFTNPASGNHRSITFESDGVGWREIARTAADVPN